MSKNSQGMAKPLKGANQFDSANIGDLSVDNLSIPSNVLTDLMVGLNLSNVLITNSEIQNSIIGVNGPNAIYATTITATGDVLFNGQNNVNYLSWDSTTNELEVNGTFVVTGCGYFGNLEICVNTIKATNAGGSINLIPNNLGQLNIIGPVNNVATQGNFVSNIQNGSITLISSDQILLNSTNSFYSLTTLKDQTNSTLNGDITLQTETGIGNKLITLIDATGGNIRVTTAQNNNLRTGDTITITGSNSTPLYDGTYTVGQIYNTTRFQLMTTEPIISNATIGSLIKTPSNDINLIASQYVTIPRDIPLTFGNTNGSNYIMGNTGGMYIISENNIAFSTGNVNQIQVPINTQLVFGNISNGSVSNSGSINYDTSGNFNIANENTAGAIVISGSTLYDNAIDTFIYDPNPMIGNFASNQYDLSDRGIQFTYPDPNSTNGNMFLGWFGYKTNTQQFTFYQYATNNNEIMTGIPGSFDINTISVTNLNLNSGGTLNVACGNITNVKLITGCSGTININASNNVNISTGTRLALISGGDIYIPNNIPLTIGTNGTSIIENTSNTLILSQSTGSILLNTNISVILPINTKLSFDGTSVGSASINLDTSSNINLIGNKNIYITTTGGNVIIPSKTSILFGTTNSSISGDSAGILLISSSGSISLISDTNVNISSSSGNILLEPKIGDILLYTSQGNVRISDTKYLVFGTTGINNSIRNDSNGNLLINGNNTIGSIFINNTNSINLNASSNVNIPTNIQLNISTLQDRYIIADTNGNFNIVNNNTNGNLSLYKISGDTILSNSNGNLIINNQLTSLTTNNLTITGYSIENIYVPLNNTTAGSILNINTQNVKITDPILTLANYTQGSSDTKDRGIEYYWYNNTTASMKMGWFGYKTQTGKFTFFSDAINNNEVITGTLGSFEFGDAVLGSLSSTNINLNCGTISNLNTILGCNGVVNIIANNTLGNSSLNISTATVFINASNNIQLPYSVPLSFGTTENSIVSDTNGNLIITSLNQVVLNANLQVNGTTTNVYSTVTNIVDPIISLGGITSSSLVNDLKDRGIQFLYTNTAGTLQKTGFFGYQNSTESFVFIPDGTNTNEIFSGSYGNVIFGNGSFNNLNLNCGTISNVSVLTGCSSNGLTLTGTSINTSSSNINLIQNSQINFGSTNVNMSSNSSGDLILMTNNTNAGIYLNTNNGFVNITQNTQLQFGGSSSGNYITRDSSGNMNIVNSTGNIYLTPQTGTNGSVYIPYNNNLIFGNSSQNSISSDGLNLNLYGYNGVSINSSTVTFNGNINVIGSINALSTSISTDAYILPLGRFQEQTITSVVNSATTGNVLITTSFPNYLSIGDQVIITNTDSNPVIDGTYFVNQIISPTTISIPHAAIIAPGTTGHLTSNLVQDQNADVGIAVNYWNNTTGNGITSGNAYYHTAFFGFMETSGNWLFYRDAAISSNYKNVISGTLGDIVINKLNTNNISGFTLDGPLVGGTNIIAGSNFQISGGQIDDTAIGQTTPANGRFTNLTSTVSTDIANVDINGTLTYQIDRYTLSTLLLQQNPNLNTVLTYVNVTGNNLITYGTLGSVGILDGQIKKINMSHIGPGCKYILHVGNGKLNAPMGNITTGSASQVLFKSCSQSVELIWDGSNNYWNLNGGSGAYIS